MNQKTSLQKSLFPRLSLKAISLFTVIVFLCSDFLSFPPQALAYEKPTIDNRLSTTDQGSGFQSPVFGLQSEVMVPSEIGTITEASLPQTIDHRLQSQFQSFEAKRKLGQSRLPPIKENQKSGQTTDKNKKSVDRGLWAVDRFVVLIQDAHAIPDAQRSLEKLIEYFQKKYGVKTVALEGAEGRLDSTLFRLFPDAEKRQSVFADYLASGELSGAAAASVLSSSKADYVGRTRKAKAKILFRKRARV